MTGAVPLLLRADLQALQNLGRTDQGKRILRSVTVSLVWMLLVSVMWGSGAALARQFPDGSVPPRVDLLAGLLAPGLVLSVATALGAGRRQLLEHSALEMLLTTPVRPVGILFALWVRLTLLASVWVAALCGPAVWLLLGSPDDPEVGAGWSAVPDLVLSILAITGPVLGIFMLLHLVLARVAGGRASRTISMLLHVLVSVAFFGLVIVGLVARERVGADGLAALGGQRYGLRALLAAPAGLLDAAGDPAGAAAARAARLQCGLTLAAALGALLALGAPLFRAAYAFARVEGGGAAARGRVRGAWPASLAGVLWRKDVRQVIGQPRQAISLLFAPILVGALGSSGDLQRLVRDGNADLPPLEAPWGAAFAVLALWWIASLTVIPIPLLRIVQADARQWVLFRAAPVAPGAFVLHKARLPAAVVVCWPLVVAVAGAAAFGFASPAGTLLAVALALPAGACLMAWLAVFATWPWLVRPDDGEQASPRGSLAVFGGMLLLNLIAIPGFAVWFLLALRAAEQGPLVGIGPGTLTTGLVAGTWLACVLAALPALWIARANMARLLEPEA